HHSPRSTAFPYTTLFRSHKKSRLYPVVFQYVQDGLSVLARPVIKCQCDRTGVGPAPPNSFTQNLRAHRIRGVVAASYPGGRRGRSEEHTSELQSPYDLVC